MNLSEKNWGRPRRKKNGDRREVLSPQGMSSDLREEKRGQTRSYGSDTREEERCRDRKTKTLREEEREPSNCCGAGVGSEEKSGDIREEVDAAADYRPFREEERKA